MDTEQSQDDDLGMESDESLQEAVPQDVHLDVSQSVSPEVSQNSPLEVSESVFQEVHLDGIQDKPQEESEDELGVVQLVVPPELIQIHSEPQAVEDQGMRPVESPTIDPAIQNLPDIIQLDDEWSNGNDDNLSYENYDLFKEVC